MDIKLEKPHICGFSSFVSTPTPLTCTVSGVLTRSPYREFSVSCPLHEWGKNWPGHFQRKDPRHRASIRHCDAMFDNPDEIRFGWCEYFCTAIYLEVSGTATIGMGRPIGGGCIAETSPLSSRRRGRGVNRGVMSFYQLNTRDGDTRRHAGTEPRPCQHAARGDLRAATVM